MIANTRAILFFVACCFTLSACNISEQSQPKTAPNQFTLTSSEMINGGKLPITYTCDGDGISPPLHWSGAPKGTKAYVLTMHHNAPDGTHWYWTLYNIAAEITDIKSNETVGDAGANSHNDLNGYAPPCSKGPGDRTYIYTIYALSAPVVFTNKTKIDGETLLTTIKELRLDSAQINVMYARNGKVMNPPKD